MTTRVALRAGAREADLLQRLQNMLYEFHALGRFDDARPHILWLMEIADQARAGSEAKLIRLS